MPLGIGYVGDPHHDDQVRDLVELERFYREQLTEPFQNVLRYQKIYFTQREDQRKLPDESWRANFSTPMGYVVVETLVAAVTDILLAADPPIQAEGVGDEDEGPARKVERLLDYTLRVNQWRKKLEGIIREAAIQGTALFKVVWREERRPVKMFPSSSQIATFEQAVDAAVAMGAPPPPLDPQGFEEWRRMVAMSTGAVVPANPYGQRANVITFRAPEIERVALFDCRFDPAVDEIDDQAVFMQRIVRPRSWLLERTGDDATKPFDPAQVANALAGPFEERFSEWDQEIARMLGVTLDSNDPVYRDRAELWEVFRPRHENPYLVILNRSAVINKDATSMPYGHGENPITAVRNVQMPGYFMGLSDLAAPEKLFYELDTLRNLRIDATTISTLGVYGKLSEYGLPDVVRMIRPGTVWNLPRLDGFRKLTEGQGPPPEVWREIPEIKQDIEEATTAYANVRGAPSTVGRVSAREAEQRAQSAMTRLKIRGIHFEEELHRAVRQICWLWYQFGEEELSLRVGGDSPDPYITLSKEELLEAFDVDFRFRGATRSGSRELQTQQLMEWGKTFGAILKPHRIAALASRIYENMGLKGRQEIIPDSDIAELRTQYEMQQAQAAQMAQQQALGVQPAPAQLTAGSEAPMQGMAAPAPDGAVPPQALGMAPAEAVPVPGAPSMPQEPLVVSPQVSVAPQIIMPPAQGVAKPTRKVVQIVRDDEGQMTGAVLTEEKTKHVDIVRDESGQMTGAVVTDDEGEGAEPEES